MRILYFDNNGDYIETAAPNPKYLEIPVLVRYNSSTDNFVCQIGEDKSIYRDRLSKERKKAAQYIFYDMTFVHPLDKPLNIAETWEVDNFPDLGNKGYMLKEKLQELLDWFIRNYCMRLTYETREQYSWMGETYYYYDVLLDKMYNTKVCLFGHGHIFKRNIKNCLIYIYGDYEIHD